MQARKTDLSRGTCGCRFGVFSPLRSFAWANDTKIISKTVLIIFIFIFIRIHWRSQRTASIQDMLTIWVQLINWTVSLFQRNMRKNSRLWIKQIFICKLGYIWLTSNHSKDKEIAKIDFQIDLKNRCVLKSKPNLHHYKTLSESYSEAKIPPFLKIFCW